MDLLGFVGGNNSMRNKKSPCLGGNREQGAKQKHLKAILPRRGPVGMYISPWNYDSAEDYKRDLARALAEDEIDDMEEELLWQSASRAPRA